MKMKNTLSAYCTSAGITAVDTTLTAICWSGLSGTPAWNNLPSSTRSNYIDICFQQLSAGGCP